jgi:uncharacterized membrane protein
MDYEKRGCWINKFFSEVLIVGVVVGAIMIFLSASIYESAISQTSLSPLSIAAVIAVIAIAVVVLVYRLRVYSKEMAIDAKQ